MMALSDSYGGIMKIDQETSAIDEKKGWCLVTILSHIRPKGTPVLNSALTSTGGSFRLWSVIQIQQGKVAQDGRRGALMLSISIKHPDSERIY